MNHEKRTNTSWMGGEPHGGDLDQALSLEPLTENELWAYALDVLDPEERDRILARVALDPEAQETVAAIRSAISVADRNPPPPLRLIGSATRSIYQKLETLKRQFGPMAAVILDMGDRLVAASTELWSGEPEVSAVPAMLGRDKPKSDEAESGQVSGQRIERQGPDGLTVIVVRRPDGRIDLDVRLSEPPTEGEVRLLRLVFKEGTVEKQETYLDQPLREGRAVLKRCPHGVYQIIAPGDRQMLLCLEPGQR